MLLSIRGYFDDSIRQKNPHQNEFHYKKCFWRGNGYFMVYYVFKGHKLHVSYLPRSFIQKT